MKHILLLCAVAVLVAGTLFAEDEFKYDSKGRRDPFTPLVGVGKTVSAGLENITSIENLNIEGIARGAKGKNIAILNGEMVKEGDVFGALVIKKITSNTVTVNIGGLEYTLQFSEEKEGEKKNG